MKNLIYLSVLLLGWSGCFKRALPNQNALLQQAACGEAISLGDYERARIHCELCLEYDRSLPECLNGIGLIALARFDDKKAIEYFTRAIRQNNDFSEGRSNLGVVYFRLGEFKRAHDFFLGALTIDPSNTDARYNLGLSKLRIAEIARNRGQGHLARQDLMEAKDHLHKLLALDPDFQDATRDLGLIELYLFDLSPLQDEAKVHLTNAENHFKTCLKANELLDVCHEGLGQTYVARGQFQDAFTSFFVCLSRNPQNSGCRTNVALAYEKSNFAAKAWGSFLVGKDSNDALALDALCAALFERGQATYAAKECQKALTIKPTLGKTHFRLASYFASILDAKAASLHCQALLVHGGSDLAAEKRECQNILLTLTR